MLRMSITTDMVIKKLNSKRYITIVPEIAVVNKNKVTQKKEDVVYFEGRPISAFNEEYRKHIVSEVFDDELENLTVKFTKARTGPGFYVDGKLKKDSEYKPTEVYLTIAEIIDIHHEGYYIRFKNNDIIFNLTKDISDALDMLEAAVDVSKANDIKKYINDFYITMTDNKEKVIKQKLFGNNKSDMMVSRTKLIRKKTVVEDRGY